MTMPRTYLHVLIVKENLCDKEKSLANYFDIFGFTWFSACVHTCTCVLLKPFKESYTLMLNGFPRPTIYRVVVGGGRGRGKIAQASLSLSQVFCDRGVRKEETGTSLCH